jgi:hypothetical protein
MARATQLNLVLENETGTLARLCRDLADSGVNVLALLAPETANGRASVRLLVANRELATKALARAGYGFDVEEVLFLELKNRPGALAKAVEKLARAEINIRFAYVTTFMKARKAAAIIAVAESELERAAKLLP